MPHPSERPIAELALDVTERREVLGALRQLLRDLGPPGEYGYGSQLWVFIQDAIALRQEIERTPARMPEAVPA